jgi:hypothetical protein
MRIFGIVLIVIGIIGLVYGGISWTRQDEVADIGPIEITASERETIPLPPIVGGICLAVGTVMVLAGGRKVNV